MLLAKYSAFTLTQDEKACVVAEYNRMLHCNSITRPLLGLVAKQGC